MTDLHHLLLNFSPAESSVHPNQLGKASGFTKLITYRLLMSYKIENIDIS